MKKMNLLNSEEAGKVNGGRPVCTKRELMPICVDEVFLPICIPSDVIPPPPCTSRYNVPCRTFDVAPCNFKETIKPCTFDVIQPICVDHDVISF